MTVEVKYFIKALDETVSDARLIDTVESWAIKDESLLELLAEDAAQKEWDRDGWEWMRDGDVFITLVADGKELGDFDIEIEMTPIFAAVRKK